MAAALDQAESMDEDFTGFDEEPIVVNPSGAAMFGADLKLEDVPETDSDSGALVIAEAEKKPETKSAEKSPRKRRSRAVEDATPTRAPSSRVKGQGLAYLIAMEKGGSKKQLAKAQAQVDAQEAQHSAPATADPLALPVPEADLPPEPEPVKKAKETQKPAKEPKETTKLKEKEPVKAPSSPAPDSPAAPTSKAKSGHRKSHSGLNISSPLLKEPFKEGTRDSSNFRARS